MKKKLNFGRGVGIGDKRSYAYQRMMDNKSTPTHSFNHPTQVAKRNKAKQERG